MMKQVGLGRYTISPDKNNPIFSRLNINESLMPGIGQCELIAHSYKLAYGQIANVLDNLVFKKMPRMKVILILFFSKIISNFCYSIG